MSVSWPALHAQLLRSSQTLAFQRRFQAIRQAEPALDRFSDPLALLDGLHGPGGDAAARNAVLAALVRQAQAGAEAANSLLLLALWPGLDAVHRRLRRHFVGEPGLLVSEISSRLVAGIHQLDFACVTWIAATLIRNTERDVMRTRQKVWADAKRRVEISHADRSGEPCRDHRLDLDPDEAVARLVDHLNPLLGADARLVVAIAVVGERQRDAAKAAGLTADVGRKRYQRALKRLRVHVEEIA